MSTEKLLQAGAEFCRFRTSAAFSLRMFHAAARLRSETAGQELKLVCQLRKPD